MDKLESAIRRGGQAQDLLNSDIFKDVIAAVRGQAVQILEQGTAATTGKDDAHFVARLQGLQAITDTLYQMINAGKMARQELEEISQSTQ